MIRRIVILSLLFWSSLGVSLAQFYSTGRSSSAVRWNEIKTDDYQLLFPQSYSPSAQRLSHFLDSVHRFISIGIATPPRRVPILMHTGNVRSNGYVTWAPRREELVMIPPESTYPMLWSRQLSIHEWRHVVQISALNRGLTRIASWLLGEAGSSLGLFVVARWQMEGDAVLAETQLSEYGRGMQPNFTVAYRTLFADGRKNFKYLDPWVCGSFKHPYPDYYHFGYQVMSAAETFVDPGNFGKILAYSSRWPIFLYPEAIYLKRHYQTSYKKIAQRAFAELDSIWKPLSNVEENFEQVTSENPRTYTQYQWPAITSDGKTISLKTTWDTPSAFVFSSSGSPDRRIKYTGPLTSRPILRSDVLYWSEYKPHPIYEQESFSVVRSLDLTNGRSRTFHRSGRNYFVTPLGNNGFATVALTDQMSHLVRFFDGDFNPLTEFRFPDQEEITLHGLAWDSVSNRLGFIALSRQGMWLGTLDHRHGELDTLTRPSMVALSDLTASDGRFYFSSTASGKNEVHTIDIATKVEHRLTVSRFGSQAPTVVGDSVIFSTTRTRGEMVATAQVSTDSSNMVFWSRLPRNLTNPVRYRWPAPVFDTLSVDSLAVVRKPERRYRRAANWFNVHSWAPVSFDADYLMENRPMQVALGATAFFQSVLSDMTGFLSYGWVNQSNWLKGRVRYTGLPLTISVAAEYGGGDQLFYSPIGAPSPSRFDPYLGIDLGLSLPLNLSAGESIRQLQPSIALSYNNARIMDNNESYREGMISYTASLWWSSARRTAYRSITPRLGYALRLNMSGGFDRKTGKLYSIWARGYLPGVAVNHSLTLKAGAQYQQLAEMNFAGKVLTPRGYYDPDMARSYGAASIEYTAPVAYPDWGIDGVIYIRRIWASAFGDYSTGEYAKGSANNFVRDQAYSYGVNIGFDLTLMRKYQQGFSIMVAQPKSRSLFFGFNYSLSF